MDNMRTSENLEPYNMDEMGCTPSGLEKDQHGPRVTSIGSMNKKLLRS